jgi:CubicO group peptidase (beta-lactamase class C family)
MGEKDLSMGKTKTATPRKTSCRSIITGILGFSVLISLMNCVGCQTFRRIPQTGQQRREDLKPELATLIDEFRSSVPKIMKKDKISGCSLALVDEKGILWAEGFGTTDFKRKIPVTPSTLFDIGSVGKIFTATAILLAVQDGLLELDEPITTYLSDFKVYSRYEEQAESKITLRHLLGHTSGLPHEAVGCNTLEPVGTLEDRINGIVGMWLKCPVGEAHNYSPAGYDLAAHILQRVSGIPFEEYMTERILRPLGMLNSTIGQNDIRSNTNRAIGQMIGIAEFPPAHGWLGAGSVWTSAEDLANLVQFYINRGSIEGNRLLNESLIDVMQTPRSFFMAPEMKVYYGLGIIISRHFGEIEMFHSGGSLGYSSLAYWCPKYGIGGLLLTNRVPLASMNDLAIGRKLIWDRRVEARFPEPKLGSNQCVPIWTIWPEHAPSPYKPEWSQYCGTFRLRFGGFKLKWWANLVLALNLDQFTPRIKVFEKEEYLCLTESLFYEKFSEMPDRQVDSKLMEAKPGVFYTASGDVLDFSGKDPTWRSYRFKKR